RYLGCRQERPEKLWQGFRGPQPAVVSSPVDRRDRRSLPAPAEARPRPRGRHAHLGRARTGRSCAVQRDQVHAGLPQHQDGSRQGRHPRGGISGARGSHLIRAGRGLARRAAILVASSLLAFSLLPERSRAADPPPPLIGRWESVVRSTGGLGQVMELRPDGTMTQWTAVLVELTYQVHGPLLLTFYRHPGSGTTETQAAGIRFDGDTMIQKDPQT